LKSWYSPSTHSSMRFSRMPSLSWDNNRSQPVPQITLMTFHPGPRKLASSSWMILRLPRTGPHQLGKGDHRPEPVRGRAGYFEPKSVRYVLEGSVRKAGNRVRITAQLIDATSAAHVWAERYDRALDDIFALQDELTLSVVGAIEPSLQQAEIARARRKRPDSLDAYDLYLRALPTASIAMPDTADAALPLLQQAIAIEPDYAAAHAAIAFCYENRFIRGGRSEDDKSTALRHARTAIATGGDDATALALAGFVIGILERDYHSAFAAFDRALALSPSSAIALCFSAHVRAWAGDYPTAVEQAEQSLRLSPFGSLAFVPHVGLAYAHFFAGRC
jgi:adenylate cyclase